MAPIRAQSSSRATTHHSGFTLPELLVSIAAPRYFRSIDRAKENALRSSLNVMREGLEQFAADKGRYPDSLAELVEARYLRTLPVAPATGSSTTWIVLPPVDPATKGKVYDIRSGAAGRASDGRLLADW